MEAGNEGDSSPSFFVRPAVSDTAILLVDTSGSVTFPYDSENAVFDKFLAVAQGLGHARFRVLFWNSEQKGTFFDKGYFKIPFVATKGTLLRQAFWIAGQNITKHCLTEPHLGFCAIQDWLDERFSQVVYLFTDGEIGWPGIAHRELDGLKARLRNGVSGLLGRYRDLQLNIVAVETQRRDFGQCESLEGVAGCDVYRVLAEGGLARSLSRFVSYNPLYDETGYVHVDRTRAPPGHVPFRDCYFSELHADLFVGHVAWLVRRLSRDEEGLLRLLQDLSVSLGVLCAGKSPTLSDRIVAQFGRMFAGTAVDGVVVAFLLRSALREEAAGAGGLFAEYRARMRDLYRQADQLLREDVRAALGVRNDATVVSMPVHGVVVVAASAAHCYRETLGFRGGGRPFGNAAWRLDGQLVPLLLPIDFDPEGNGMAEQCARQWVRQLVAWAGRLHPSSDDVLYRSLGLALQAVLSEGLDDDVRALYRRLGRLMLRKRRAHSDATEWQSIEEGRLPVSSSDGRTSALVSGMKAVGLAVGLDALRPLTVWFLVCLALGSEAVVTAQFLQCEESIRADFPDAAAGRAAAMGLLDHGRVRGAVHQLRQHTVALEDSLDYTCFVTMEDTSATGGHAFHGHASPAGDFCCPRQVFSPEGFAEYIASADTAKCPFCYARLGEDDFRPVPPRSPLPPPGSVFASGLPPAFGEEQGRGAGAGSSRSAPKSASTKRQGTTPASDPPCDVPPSAPSVPPTPSASKCARILVSLCGTVGAGKTTYAEKMRRYVESWGGRCLVVGVDAHCSAGMGKAEAVERVRADIGAWLKESADGDDGIPLVLIVDACGNNGPGKRNVFGHDLSDWEEKRPFPNWLRSWPHERRLRGYMAWSLRNVLQRGPCSPGCGYWLNPADAGVDRCLDIHLAKARTHFGKKKTPRLVSPDSARTAEEAIAAVDDDADAYGAAVNEAADPDFAVLLASAGFRS